MAMKNVIEVPLPDGVEPSREDIELLEGTFRALLCLRYGGGREGDALTRLLQERGWSVSVRPGWVAEARRGGDVEKAAGGTRAEALAELESLARLDELVPTY
jgi:hypothetical protein